jgi:hypothetical protein
VTPEFMTAEGNELIAAFERGYRRGLEDAAKIAEEYGWSHVYTGELTAAIRARITPRNTTPTGDRSKE